MRLVGYRASSRVVAGGEDCKQEIDGKRMAGAASTEVNTGEEGHDWAYREKNRAFEHIHQEDKQHY